MRDAFILYYYVEIFKLLMLNCSNIAIYIESMYISNSLSFKIRPSPTDRIA
jgi:hypothetical protein